MPAWPSPPSNRPLQPSSPDAGGHRRVVTQDAVSRRSAGPGSPTTRGARSTTTSISALIKSLRNSDVERRPLLAGPPDRGRRRSDLHRPAPLHPRLGGRRPGRPPGDGSGRRRGADHALDRPPRGPLPAGQATIYLARAPKSNAVKTAYSAAAADAAATAREPVPLHLRNAVTPLMKASDMGRDIDTFTTTPPPATRCPACPRNSWDGTIWETRIRSRNPRSRGIHTGIRTS